MNLNHDQVVSPVKNNPPSWLNSAAVNMRCTYPSGLCFSPDICRSGIAGWYGSSVFSFFYGTSILLSTVADCQAQWSEKRKYCMIPLIMWNLKK